MSELPVVLTHKTCKQPNVRVVKRSDFVTYMNERLDPRYQLCPHSLSKGMEIYSATKRHLKLTISSASRNRYILEDVVPDLIVFIMGRQKDIPEWRRRAEARSRRAAAAFKPARDSDFTEEDVTAPPVVTADAACEVNRILESRASHIASLYAEAIMAAPRSKPVLRLGATSYVSLYEDPHV